ncbi:MAG: hypothetical protein KF685_06160 [Acidobacteria bacterium]|nr:hypothetical protein [Acidobacteriota bacterium]
MDLMNDLSNDLAFTFLVERKNEGDLTSREVRELIDRIKLALSPVEMPEQRKAVNDHIHISRSNH